MLHSSAVNNDLISFVSALICHVDKNPLHLCLSPVGSFLPVSLTFYSVTLWNLIFFFSVLKKENHSVGEIPSPAQVPGMLHKQEEKAFPYCHHLRKEHSKNHWLCHRAVSKIFHQVHRAAAMDKLITNCNTGDKGGKTETWFSNDPYPWQRRRQAAALLALKS